MIQYNTIQWCNTNHSHAISSHVPGVCNQNQESHGSVEKYHKCRSWIGIWNFLEVYFASNHTVSGKFDSLDFCYVSTDIIYVHCIYCICELYIYICLLYILYVAIQRREGRLDESREIFPQECIGKQAESCINRSSIHHRWIECTCSFQFKSCLLHTMCCC